MYIFLILLISHLCYAMESNDNNGTAQGTTTTILTLKQLCSNAILLRLLDKELTAQEIVTTLTEDSLRLVQKALTQIDSIDTIKVEKSHLNKFINGKYFLENIIDNRYLWLKSLDSYTFFDIKTDKSKSIAFATWDHEKKRYFLDDHGPHISPSWCTVGPIDAQLTLVDIAQNKEYRIIPPLDFCIDTVRELRLCGIDHLIVQNIGKLCIYSLLSDANQTITCKPTFSLISLIMGTIIDISTNKFLFINHHIDFTKYYLIDINKGILKQWTTSDITIFSTNPCDTVDQSKKLLAWYSQKNKLIHVNSLDAPASNNKLPTLATITGHPDLNSLQFLSDSKYLIGGTKTKDHSIYIWHWITGICTFKYTMEIGSPLCRIYVSAKTCEIKDGNGTLHTLTYSINALQQITKKECGKRLKQELDDAYKNKITKAQNKVVQSKAVTYATALFSLSSHSLSSLTATIKDSLD